MGNQNEPQSRPAAEKEVAKPAGGSKPSSGSSKSDKTSNVKMVLGKYQMHTGHDDVMGEGTSSICWKGTEVATKKSVAIKVYKGKGGESTLIKFRRQIEVLQELAQPFKEPADKATNPFWTDRLAKAKPSRLFLELLDFSKDAKGQPGPDPKDNTLYVVTELGQYSLKDYLHHRHEQQRPLSADSVRNITEAILLVMAGLHQKGLVHIDFKPENIMMFNGRLKLIDVDGCVRKDTKVAITDSSISFSPCYCAPEWARFLIDESDSHIAISPALDVWSVGMTVCELITLDPVLKSTYASFLRNGKRPQQEAGFLFMEWLSSSTMRIPSAVASRIKEHDKDFLELITSKLLVNGATSRNTLAEALGHAYFKGPPKDDKDPKKSPDDEQQIPMTEKEHIKRRVNRKEVKESVEGQHIQHKGVLWKLNTGGNLKETTHWLMRDMWIAEGNLCYFSQRDNKRLVLMDCSKISRAIIAGVPDGSAAKEHVFKIQSSPDHEHDSKDDVAYFAAESGEEQAKWIKFLQDAGKVNVAQTMKLGAGLAKELQQFKLLVRNRRMKVDNQGAGFEPVFKSKLWKVKSEGDKMQGGDWFEREFWISKNGSFVYYSAKEERELIYYTASDVSNSEVHRVPSGDSCKPCTFAVHLPEVDGISVAPGEFAAPDEAVLSSWLEQFSSHGAKIV